MKIGIYGGTFDPPHLGHMEAARVAMETLSLDRLLIIPDREPPHKDLTVESASPQQRLAMAALMADGLGPRAEASDLEIRREGKSFTADTVEELHQAFPEDELWLLMGTDMFLTVQNWYQPERIFQYAGVAAFARHEEDTEELFAQQSKFLEETYHARTTVVPLPQVKEIASRDLRRMLASEWTGGNVDPAQYLWTPVYGYILREGLFGTKADLKQLSDKHLRAISYAMVKAKRLPHIQGTEETAAALAAFWGGLPGEGPPGGHPPRLHQVLDPGAAPGDLRQVRGGAGRAGVRVRQAPPLQVRRRPGPARVCRAGGGVPGHQRPHHRQAGDDHL